MKNQTKRMISFIASACMVATSLTTFGVSAEDEEVSVTEAPVITSEAVKTTAETETKTTTQTEVKTTSNTETVKTTETTNDTVEQTTKSLVVATDDENVTTTVITSGANGTTVSNADGTIVTTTIDGTTSITTIDDTTTTTTIDGTTSAISSVGTTIATTKTATDNAETDTTQTTVTTAIDGTTITTTFDDTTSATTTAIEELYTHTNDVVLTIDTSVSMEGEPLELVRKTAIDLVNKILDEDPDAKISLVNFEDLGYYTYFTEDEDPNSKFEYYINDREELINAINSIIDRSIEVLGTEDEEYFNMGGTDFLSAIDTIKFVLDNGTGEEKSVVIMTDGISGTTTQDEDGTIFYDVPDNIVFGEEWTAEYKSTVLDYADEVIKPLATIYTIGYFQNLENGEQAGQARDFLLDLASDGVEGAKFYEANENNIDEITDLITQDIVYDAPPTKPVEETTTTTTVDKDANSPKTSDTGVGSVIVLGGLACALVVITKKKND